MRGLLRSKSDGINRAARLLDLIAAFAIIYLMYLCNGLSDVNSQGITAATVFVLLILTAFFLNAFNIYRSYRNQTLQSLALRIFLSVALVYAASSYLLTLTLGPATQFLSALALWTLLFTGYLFMVHLGGRKFLHVCRSRGFNTRSVIFIGNVDECIQFAHSTKQIPYSGTDIKAFFVPCPLPELNDYEGNIPWIPVHEVVEWSNYNDMDHVYISDSMLCGGSTNILDELANLLQPISVILSWQKEYMKLTPHKVNRMTAIQLFDTYSSNLDRSIKRLFDVIAAVLLVVALLPFHAVIATLICIDSPGGVFFLQKRCGLDSKTFVIFKYRTMYRSTQYEYPDQATRDDARVTRLGRLLRRYSIDELPQLLNVILGDMSIVGPRPHALEHDERFRSLFPQYAWRHLFKPGMSGLAQIYGHRGEIQKIQDLETRIQYDLKYMQDWSLSLDLKILIKTFKLLLSTSAY